MRFLAKNTVVISTRPLGGRGPFLALEEGEVYVCRTSLVRDDWDTADIKAYETAGASRAGKTHGPDSVGTGEHHKSGICRASKIWQLQKLADSLVGLVLPRGPRLESLPVDSLCRLIATALMQDQLGCAAVSISNEGDLSINHLKKIIVSAFWKDL